ncbi:MAG: deoxyribonuclease IV [Chlamydiota bacterium]|nr:deoxyribonuclease IV [Chlamydiota bacterium]
MTKNVEELLIGAHTSAAGGVHNALLEGQQIGATTIQLFTANQRQWATKPLTQESIDNWNEALQKTGLQKIMSHDSYLINLCSSKEDILSKSRKAFQLEIDRCTALGITYLNFHPGAALKDDPELCLERICESLLLMEPYMENSPTRLLLESTAGQGSTLGYAFEHLAYIIERVKDRLPIGVCIDTCHSFVAGYDLRTEEAVNKTLNEFDRVVGLQHLYAFHFNDSVKGLGSRVDRHRPLGEGEIGSECFKALMRDPRTRELPKYLETPGGNELWKKEILMLREWAKQ